MNGSISAIEDVIVGQLEEEEEAIEGSESSISESDVSPSVGILDKVDEEECEEHTEDADEMSSEGLEAAEEPRSTMIRRCNLQMRGGCTRRSSGCSSSGATKSPVSEATAYGGLLDVPHRK